MTKHSNLKEQLLSLIIQILLAIAFSFLYAVVIKDCWNWFVIRAVPVAAELSYPIAYGISLFLNIVCCMLSTPRADKDDAEAQQQMPILYPILKKIIKVVVILALWGFAAICHLIIG